MGVLTMSEKNCRECGGKDGLHKLTCSALDAGHTLILSHIDGFTAGLKGEPRVPPEGITDDDQWTWLAAYDNAIRESG